MKLHAVVALFLFVFLGSSPGARADSCFDPSNCSFLDKAGNFTIFNVPGATQGTWAYGINNAGEIVGYYCATTEGFSGCFPGTYLGFLYNAGTFTTIDVPGARAYRIAKGINDAGQIVGSFFGRDFTFHGFLDNAGTFTTIDVPGALATWAEGINNTGQIVGTYCPTGVCISENQLGFLYNAGTFKTIDVPGALSTDARGINDAGEIVGTFLDNTYRYHGFLDDAGTFTTIDFPGSFMTLVDGINDTGQLVGFYCSNFYYFSCDHGFLDAGGTFTSIDVPGWGFTTPQGINDAGEIVGFGGTHMPEPASVLLLGTGLLALAYRLRRKPARNR